MNYQLIKEAFLETGKNTKQSGQSPEVGIVMGSDSDLSVMEETTAVLKKFDLLPETAG